MGQVIYKVSQASRSQVGFSLLEFTFTLPVILVLILGSIDILNYFRTVAALAESAKLVAREVSTLNGAGFDTVPLEQLLEYRWSKYELKPGSVPEVVKKLLATSNAPPAVCLTSVSTCTRELQDVNQLPTQTFKGDRRIERFQETIDKYGAIELATVLPKANFNCGPNVKRAHCAQFTIDLADRANEVTVSARYFLPFLVLGSDVIKVETFVSARLEPSLINNDISVSLGAQ